MSQQQELADLFQVVATAKWALLQTRPTLNYAGSGEITPAGRIYLDLLRTLNDASDDIGEAIFASATTGDK